LGERQIHRVCVFCGSRSGGDSAYADDARTLGEALAARAMGLVFGGGHIGLMGVLADAVLKRGGDVIGVIPQGLVDRELAHSGVKDMRIVPTMHQRKAVMADLADAFIALPGGYGTADEFFEILTWAQLGLHAKPIGLLNTGGYFDSLLAWIDRSVQEGFLRASHRDLLRVARRPEELVDLLLRVQPPAGEPKWIAPEER